MNMCGEYCEMSNICDESDEKGLNCCEDCQFKNRFQIKTIDNWESFIIDKKTGKEYGCNVEEIIDLLNSQEKEIHRLSCELNLFEPVIFESEESLMTFYLKNNDIW